MNINEAIRSIQNGTYDETLRKLYPSYDADPQKYQGRICSLLETYRSKEAEIKQAVERLEKTASELMEQIKGLEKVLAQFKGGKA